MTPLFFYYTGHLAVDATGRLHEVTQADGHALAGRGGGRGPGSRGGRTLYRVLLPFFLRRTMF